METEAFLDPQRLLVQEYKGRAVQVSELSIRRVRCSGEIRVQGTVNARGCQETFCIFALITSRRLSQSDLRERMRGKGGKDCENTDSTVSVDAIFSRIVSYSEEVVGMSERASYVTCTTEAPQGYLVYLRPSYGICKARHHHHHHNDISLQASQSSSYEGTNDRPSSSKALMVLPP